MKAFHKILKSALVTFIMLTALTTKAQESTFGDSLVLEAFKEEVSKIYNNSDKTYFFLTAKKFQAEVVSGTTITAY